MIKDVVLISFLLSSIAGAESINVQPARSLSAELRFSDLANASIYNRAGCDVAASDIGVAESRAILMHDESKAAGKVVQVVSVRFANCQLIFGRVIEGEDRPPYDLLGEVGARDGRVIVDYSPYGFETNEQLIGLARSLVSMGPSSHPVQAYLTNK